MAQLKKKLFGDIIGGFGDAIYRERFGENFISQKPVDYTTPMDAASIARRKRFRLTGKTAKSIYGVKPLKGLWQQVTPPDMPTYPYIFSTNYKYVTDVSVSDMLQIVPGYGFGVTVTTQSVDATKVNVVMAAIGENAGINKSAEPNMMMGCVLFLSDPVNQESDPYILLSLASVSQPTDLAGELTFDAILTSQQSQIFNAYQVNKAYIAVVTLDSQDNPVHYSSTVLLT